MFRFYSLRSSNMLAEYTAKRTVRFIEETEEELENQNADVSRIDNACCFHKDQVQESLRIN